MNRMGGRAEVALNRVFHALASEARRDILRRTATAPCTVTELATHFDMSLAAVSKHVRVLDEANLLTARREGRLHWRRLNREALCPAGDVIQHLHQFWDTQLAGLHAFLAETASSRKRAAQSAARPRPKRLKAPR